jgi:hypothetical protein
MDRTGENHLVPRQVCRQDVAALPSAFLSVPVVTAAVCGRALSWRRQTLLTDRPRRLNERLVALLVFKKTGIISCVDGSLLYQKVDE